MLDIIQKAYTFDDLLLVPQYANFLPKDVVLQTKLSRNLNLNIPLISAAMDSVTESKMAIAMAQEGGIGIIHKNMSPQYQASRVSLVKRHEAGIVKDPISINSTTTVRQLLVLTSKRKISGMPVVDNNNLVGIITNRDVRYVNDLEQTVGNLMTPKNRLITIKEGDSTALAKSLMHQHRIERVLVVNDLFELKGLITAKDLTKEIVYPHANKDSLGRLRVGAAIGINTDSEQRIELLCNAEVDVVIIDTAHGHSKGVIERVRWIKQNYPNLELIAGNIATAEAAHDLLDCGIDGLKVGIGPGSICTTRIVAGVGIPQLTAIDNVARYLRGSEIPLIADGGIRFSGDLAKALAAGASSIMLGGMLAGVEESPGEIELYQGRSYKSYRGMGSLGAMISGSADRYAQDHNKTQEKFVPEGVEGRVPYKGNLNTVIYQLLGGLKSAMGYIGSFNIAHMHQHAKFVEITQAGIKESHVHDVEIIKESPNYIYS